MLKTSILYLRLLPIALLLTVGAIAARADKTVADLAGEDKERYETFRRLFLNGTPEEFYSFAEEYAGELHKNGYMMTRSTAPSALHRPSTRKSGATKPANTITSPQASTATSTAAATTGPEPRHTSDKPSTRWATVT